MKPGHLDLPIIWRGCDWGPVTLKWKDGGGNPIDVRAWTPVAQSLNINLGAVKTNALHGITTLSLTKAQTAHLKLGVENWDWIWQANTGAYRYPPFLSGKVAIRQPVQSVNGNISI
jgi:hypothetical protein